jgi:hypothetical protein
VHRRLHAGLVILLGTGCSFGLALDGLFGESSSNVDGGQSNADSGDAKPAQEAEPPPSRYASAVLAARPIAYYRLGESSGSFLYNEVDGGSSLVLQGSGYQRGIPGAVADNGAIRFTGAYAIPEVAEDPIVRFLMPFTIVFWIRPEQRDCQNCNYLNPIDGVGFSTRIDNPPGTDGTSTFLLYYYDGVDPWLQADIPLKSWSQIALGFDGVSSRLVVDGKDIGSIARKGDSGPAPDSRFLFARTRSGGDFLGGLDELAIFDRWLSLADLAKLYDASK